MQFLEDSSDFMNFEEEIEVDICICHECGATFEVTAGENPTTCPKCGIKFLPE